MKKYIMKVIMAGSALLLSVMFAGCASHTQAAVEKPFDRKAELARLQAELEAAQSSPQKRQLTKVPDNWGYMVVKPYFLEKQKGKEIDEYMQNVKDIIYPAWRSFLDENHDIQIFLDDGAIAQIIKIHANGTFEKMSIMNAGPQPEPHNKVGMTYLDKRSSRLAIGVDALDSVKLPPLPIGIKTLMLTLEFHYRQH